MSNETNLTLVGAIENIAAGAPGLDFRVLADAMPIMVWIGLPDGRIDYVNQFAVDFFGRTREQMRDEGWLAVIHADDVPRTIERWTHSVTTGEPYVTEFRGHRHSDDSYRWLDVRGLPLRDANGEIVRWLGSAIDMHDMRSASVALEERLQIIERQSEAIRQLSAPIIEVWEGVLTMPLLGTIDGERAQRMMEVLLEQVVARQCRYTIVDLTGVSTMDGETAEHLGRMLAAVSLLGANGIVVGIRPEVAQTVVSLGLNLSTVTTLANLREALLHCMNDKERVNRRGTRKVGNRS